MMLTTLPPPAAAHQPRGLLREHERRARVDREQPVPELDATCRPACRAAQPGRVDEPVEAPVALVARGDRPRPGSRPGARRATKTRRRHFVELLADRLAALRVAAASGRAGAPSRATRARDRGAEALGAAGDDHDLAVEALRAKARLTRPPRCVPCGLAERPPGRQADDERRPRIGSPTGGGVPGATRADERLPLAHVARHVALEEEVRQRRRARPVGGGDPSRCARAGSRTPPCPPRRRPPRAGRTRIRRGASCRSSSGSRSRASSMITAVSTSPTSPKAGSTRTAPRAKTSTISRADHEARHVEVVDRSCPGTARRRLRDVLERRRAGVAAGDAHDAAACPCRRPRRPRATRRVRRVEAPVEADLERHARLFDGGQRRVELASNTYASK